MCTTPPHTDDHPTSRKLVTYTPGLGLLPSTEFPATWGAYYYISRSGSPPLVVCRKLPIRPTCLATFPQPRGSDRVRAQVVLRIPAQHPLFFYRAVTGEIYQYTPSRAETEFFFFTRNFPSARENPGRFFAVVFSTTALTGPFAVSGY